MRKILNDFARAIVCVTVARISNDLEGFRLFSKLGSSASFLCVTIARISNDLEGFRLFSKFGSSASFLDAIPRT